MKKICGVRSRTITMVLALFLLKVSISFAQIDTAFWFAAPWVTPSHDGNTPIVFRIATFGNATAVRVHQIAGTYDTTINIPANSLYSHFVSWVVNTVETKPANTVVPYGFKISSDFPITVVYEVVTNTNLNPETFSLKGQNGLGTEFVTPFQNKWDIGLFNPVKPFAQINIVASQPNTTIWITPRCAVVGHPANVSYSITLNQGEAYTVQNATEAESSTPGKNLSGTIIVSDKPISVTVADDSVWEANAGGCRDLMGDQIVPTDVIGNEYIVNIGQMYDGTTMGGTNPNSYDSQEGIFIVATKNFTSVTINDGAVSTHTLNQGDTWYYNIKQPLTYISADKSIYVVQASGFGCELGEAIIPPLNCSGSNQVSFTRTNNQSFLLNILCKNGAQGSFTLNGSTSLVTAANFTVVPGTGGVWVGGQIQFSTAQIPSGTANLLTNSMDNFSMGVINGGRGTGCLYHYMSSFLRRVYTNAGSDLITCTNNLNINLNGSVTGGATTGVWTTPNGTGTFTSATSLSTGYVLSGLDSTKSSLTFVLTSTGNCTPVPDTMVVYIKKSPVVNAGPDITMCSNHVTPAVLNGYFNYASGINWAGGSGGSFGNNAAANTTYTASPADIASGQVLLTLTTVGSVFGCPNTVDSMYIHFTPAPQVDAGGDINVCANTPKISLGGTVSGGSTSGVWTSTGSGLFNPGATSLNPLYQFSAADLAQTSIIIKLTSTNNGFCYPVADSLTVFINPAPAVEAGVSDTICSNMGFISLNGTVSGGASNGTWSTLAGTGVFGNTSNLSTTYSFSAADTSAGQVQIVLTSTGGNCPAVKDTATYHIVKAPVVNAGPDMSICDNATIILNGAISGFTGTGNWTSTGTGSFSPASNALNTIYNPSSGDISSGTILLILTSTNNKGCNATKDTLKVTFIPSPQAGFTANNNCFGTTSVFTDASSTPVGSISGWNWNFGDGGTSISSNVVHVYSTPGTYTVTQVVTGTNLCKDTIQHPITIYGLPDANFNVNNACSGNTTSFVDTSTAYPATITNWNWNFGDGSTSTSANPTHTYANAGTYTTTLIVETNLGCYDTIKKPVIVRQSPVAAFIMSENPAVALDIIHFTDQSTPQATLIGWFWNFGDSVLSNQQNPAHSFANQGDYNIILVVTDNFGCKDTARTDINIALLPQVPTAFTPNGDGHNDVLFVRGGPFEKIHFRVYNNWGELVFQCTDQKIGWDGTVSGVDQPLGVYVWVMDVEAANKKQIHKSGDVTLMR
ncbi:MAG TPA: PKD domain-containing protein [Bacteroidia bacterium]|nr:PKD domain-containing protein [Bacteroidia bacterium]